MKFGINSYLNSVSWNKIGFGHSRVSTEVTDFEKKNILDCDEEEIASMSNSIFCHCPQLVDFAGLFEWIEVLKAYYFYVKLYVYFKYWYSRILAEQKQVLIYYCICAYEECEKKKIQNYWFFFLLVRRSGSQLLRK